MPEPATDYVSRGSRRAAAKTATIVGTVRDSATAVAWFRKRTPEQFYDFVYQVSIVPQHVYGAVAPAQLRTPPAGCAPRRGT